jgi:hypothetical protein
MIRLSQLNEASEIELSDLEKMEQQKVKVLVSHFKGKMESLFSGIHGKIVEIKVSGGHGAYRFEQGDFKLLTKLQVRWMEADGDYISIAF